MAVPKKKIVERIRQAIGRDAPSAIESLLREGLPLDEVLKFPPTLVPRTMLDYASEKNAHQTAGFLIKSGALLDKGTYSNPLITALLFNRKTMVKLLLDAGADVNGSIANPDKGDKGYTALMTAASFSGNLSMLNYLLKRGADPHRVTQRGTSALEVAVGRRNHPAIAKLVNLGCRTSGSELRVPAAKGDVQAMERSVACIFRGCGRNS